MDNKIECKICNKKLTAGNSYIGSHVKRKHGIHLKDYIINFYKNIGEDVRNIECVMCGKNIITDLIIDHHRYEYKKFPMDKYICNGSDSTEYCKNLLSLRIFGESYNRKKFEYIGSRVDYLSLLYNITVEEASNLKNITYNSILKNNPFADNLFEIYEEKIRIKNSKPHRSNLSDYKKRYGDEIGESKYSERCKKIGDSNNIDWYIKKYGESEGLIRWNNRIKKYEKSRGSTISKKQLDFYSNVLSKLGTKIDCEYRWERNGRNNYIDFFMPEKNIAIEFFGDYWHCNPKKYQHDYYHKVLKMNAFDVWRKDSERIDEIFNFFDGKINIIILWEGTNISLEEFSNVIYDIKELGIKIEL